MVIKKPLDEQSSGLIYTLEKSTKTNNIREVTNLSREIIS